MRNDEFNTVEVKNDKRSFGVEFGKTQKVEFTSQKDNKLPDGELNEKYFGKTIRKKTETNVQYSSKKVQVHGSTTVTSANTATNIAATVTTVATAASVVVVTAVAVTTGISVALHDYEYNFNSFVVTSDSLTYELFIVDHKNERVDGEPYEEYDRPREEDAKEEEDTTKGAELELTTCCCALEELTTDALPTVSVKVAVPSGNVKVSEEVPSWNQSGTVPPTV